MPNRTLVVAALAVVVLTTIAMAGAAWASEPAAAASGITLPVAVALGALQGATEFLPVSSSGHLALGQAFFEVDPEAGGHRFSIVAHGGTLLAVLWMYRRDVLELAAVPFRPLTPSPARQTLVMMVLATLPLSLVLVPGVEDAILVVESSTRLVGGCLLLTAAILFVAFRRGSEAGEELAPPPPSPRQALLVGLAQLVAVLPGVSRSGSTIAAGLGLGLSRSAAARFSFLISIPAILGATVLELRKLGQETGPVDPWPYAAGFVVSFGVGLACLRLLLLLVRRGRIDGFVIYLAIVGTAAIVWGA
ncbi:undecaprenyl-diphosphate phosphatase [Paraliomyxa miuraensis]|uniref:undecaprenyl-diphosphate phosphatase n=1 Tax=Paraliomyxa miuraensis TaxID=376150 RepID=UPI002251FDC3|nr:undecaprenyl-diphosphate phosphatase [Paraliomyxa miuraensis]MCX4245431.1 undecaprenyl-diphosphate phosphatase [Paraliomyxa miuraensis]